MSVHLLELFLSTDYQDLDKHLKLALTDFFSDWFIFSKQYFNFQHNKKASYNMLDFGGSGYKATPEG